MPVERWLADDWMLARVARPASYPPIELADFALVRWDALLAQLPGLAVLIFVALIATLVTVGSLETTLAARVDQDREARVAGRRQPRRGRRRRDAGPPRAWP